ncbi:APC family permease [Fonticella tunisiensis]|uniref:Serine/threonine exchange transporter (LAT family) n=1 Tax=Fonticella tunisiensis TaxID=1096341 RepID=A0A4R7KQ66_9CLOT|nr:amino acid permease [Fonticella tunisiensis]TDT61300.1 serine/threonine exchange transporter (LAT family) [Fonticella tunisiensis]
MEAVKEKNSNVSVSKSLKREVGLPEAITMVIGVVIGAGIFFKASTVFKNAGAPIPGVLAWVIGGLITMASALTAAEIAAAIPKTGGVFVYLKELYGERWAFLFGWVQALIYVPGVAAALAIVFVTQSTYFIPITGIYQKILAIFIMFFIMLLNIISTKIGSKVQFISTVGKLIPIFAIIVFGLVKGQAHSFSNTVSTGSAGAAGFGAAVLGTLWAYDGWIGVGNMAGELKNPKRDLPRAIILGLAITIAVYILINIAIVNIMPLQDVIGSSKPASDAAVILFGNVGAGIIAAGIMVSIFGALNGYLMTGVRIPFAMAQNRLFPFYKFFGKVNDRFETPLNMFLFEVIIASTYILSGSFDTLTNLSVFVMWIFFVMTVAGIFILRSKHRHLERPYVVPLYPIVPIIGIAGGLYIIISMLFTNTAHAVYGIIITLLGLPVYTYIKRK